MARSLVLLGAVLAVARGLCGEAPAPLKPSPEEIPPNIVSSKPAPPPAKARVLFCEGVQLKLQDKFADAIERFKKVLELDRDSPDVFFELGFCHYRLGKNKEAAAHLKRTLELDPQNGSAHETLAFVYNALGERDKALDELEAAAKSAQRPRNHEGLVQRIAWIYERQRDHKNAIKWYEFLIGCGYRDRKAYLALGTLQLKEKLYGDALASFREVVRRTRADEATVADVAAAYGQLSEAERAEALRGSEATAANSTDPATLEALSLAYQAAGRTPDMLRALEGAAAIASERTEAQREFLAEHFEDAGNIPKAIEWRLRIMESHKSPAVEQFVYLAELYVKHEEMEQAAETFRKAIAAAPRHTELYRRVADCCSELYRWDKAAAALEELVKTKKELGPADARDLFELGEFLQQAGKAQAAAERKSQAFSLLTSAIGKSNSRPTEVQLHVTLADLYYADRKPDKALDYLLVAHQLDPDEPKKLLLLAGAYKRVRKWAEAAATLRRYVEKHPESRAAAGALFEAAACQECAGQPDAAAATREEARKLLVDAAETIGNDAAKAAVRLQLGQVDLQRNQPKSAIERFLEVLRLDPKSFVAHLSLGQCYQILGDWARAAAHYKSYLDAQAVDEGEARILYRLGLAQARSGQADLGKQNKVRAIQLLTDALATLEKEKRGTPTHKAEIYRDLCGLYAGEKDYPKALDAVQKAIELAPSDKRADYRLAHASLLDDLKRYDDSERVLVETHKAEPDNPAVLNHLGYFYAERGRNLDQAVALVQKALDHEPLNGAYLDSLGWAYYQQGKHEDALKLLLRALQYEEDAVIRDHLGDAYQKLGKLHEAREAWAKAIVLDPDIEGVAEKLKNTQPKEPPKEAPEKGAKQ